ncbi:A-kinase anchor protein 13-like [Pempheris klunzingeri]|uniref:A-kinase anchor protein 13-like n=1 Tax=Pempheris klunzingeri TaxID=3127111 RepID=UPI00397EBF90
MKLNPRQAPLYGECVVTVQLDDNDVCCAEGEEEEELEIYLLFSGSTQRHLSSTLRVSQVTLQAVCPAHNVCEQVLVTLCLARPGGPVDTHSQETFCFVQDMALDMAHFLRDSGAPQEALLMADEQIRLKECERLDHQLALQHLTLPHQRATPEAPSHTHTDVDRQMDDLTLAVRATGTETPEETWIDVSTLLHSSSAVSRCQQLSSLLHVAAGLGLRTVAAFLLQQRGGREALTRPNTQELTPACVAESRGHRQLVELFTQYETSTDVQAEPKEKLHFYPEGRIFQHHRSLGIYTLTFPNLHQTEGGSEDSCLQEEVKELRRLIHLHRHKKGNSEFACTIAPTHTSTPLSVDGKPAGPACWLQPSSDGQQESKQDAGLAVVIIENCDTAAEEQGSPLSLEERTHGEDSAVVTNTSCTSGSLCKRQEAGGEHRSTRVANSPAGRNRKNKKRTAKTTRHTTKSPGSDRDTREACRVTAQRPVKTTGSRAETNGTVSPRGPAEESVIGYAAATKAHCSPTTEETPLPIKPVSAPGGDGRCAGRKTVALPTAAVEKQEEEKWEVDLLRHARVVETETVIAEQGDAESLPAEEATFDLAGEAAAGSTVSMGQEQSQDPKESQSDPEEPNQRDTANKSLQSGRNTSPTSPDMERKPQRGLWLHGSWIGSRMGSPPHEPETVAKTVWYQGENIDQGISEEWNRKEVNSQSVWYDSDTKDQRKHEQLEQEMREQKECDLNLLQASGLSSPQLLEQGLSSLQLSASPSQPHAAGTQPAPSHGPGAQRQEVDGSQQEEEVGPDWKEAGLEGDRQEVSNRETAHSRKGSETADVEEGREEKQGRKEKGAKVRKKRRKMRGKRGGSEAKFSSSSSVESQSRTEVQTDREQVTTLTTQSETESEAKDKTGRADIQAPSASEPAQQEEADKDVMHLPSQTVGQTRECDNTNSDRSCATPEFSLTDHGSADLTNVCGEAVISETKELSGDESMNFHGPGNFSGMDIREADIEEMTIIQPMGMEVCDATELDSKGLASLIQQAEDNVESKALPGHKDFKVCGKAGASVDLTGSVESNSPKELPVKHLDPTDFTEGSFLMEFPEQNAQHVQSVDTDKPAQPVDPMGKPGGFMEPVHPTEAGALPFEGRPDVSPLLEGEGRAETTVREYLEHCLTSEMLRDQQHKEEKRNELWMGEEEAAKGINWERRSEENDSGTVHGKELSSGDREKEHDNEDLVATAVAIVTVAIASAIASIELSQQIKDNRSESQESASKEPANDPSLAQEANIATDTLKQQTEHLLNAVQSTQLSPQVINRDREKCPLLAMTETENQPLEHSPVKDGHQFSSEADRSDTSEEFQSNTDAQKLPATQFSSSQQANLDTTEEIQTETTQNNLSMLGSPPKERDCPLQVNMKPLPEADEMVDSQGHTQTESHIPGPVRDTEQHPEANDTHGHDLEENLEENLGLGHPRDPQDQSVCQTESGIQAESETCQFHSHFQHSQTHDRDDSRSVESVTAEGETGRRVHEQVEAEGRESCQTEVLENGPQLDGQVTTPCEGDIPTLPSSCASTLHVTPRDSTSEADPRLEDPSAPVSGKAGEYQASRSLEDAKRVPLDAGSGTFQSKGQDSVENKDGAFEGLDRDSHALDTVEGWKDRERTEMTSEEKARTEMVTAEHTSQTEAGEQSLQTRRDPEDTHTVQIQREKDVFFPVQPCPEPHAVSPCTDGEECVSLCQLDGSVFKKPEDPPSCVAQGDRGVCVSWSSADDALIHGALSPSWGALSAGTPEAVAPQSSRLSCKAKTEDGVPGGAMGEEEENKDQLPENPVSSDIFRASNRSLSPFRRHSWEPGRNTAAADSDIKQRSSLKSLSGEAKRAKPPLHRRSMSWCPSNLRHPDQQQIESRSYSLEGLEMERGAAQPQRPGLSEQREGPTGRTLHLESQERGSLVSLTEEEQEGDGSSIDSQTSHQVLSVTNSCPAMFHPHPLTKSISMVTISHRDMDGFSSFSGNSGSLEYSISEEPGPLRSDTEGKGGPKISRTFSYLRSKMSKKGKEKERRGEKERESKEREKKSANGHLFVPISPSPSMACQHCAKLLHNKDMLLCNNCGVHVHKCCRDSLSVCGKSKTKQQALVPEAVPGSAASVRSKSSSSVSSVSSTSSSSSRERWSTVTTPDDQPPVVFPRRSPSIFNPQSNLAKSISTSNIAGLDDVPLKGLKFLSQSTDSLHQGTKVNASTESLTDEGTEMMDSQLMGEFECDIKDHEADSWSSTVDKKFLKALKKDEIKRQDVIYELYQTEFHHVRTLKIMSEVYLKGLQKELQLDNHTLDKVFPVLDSLLDMHTHFLTLLLDRKRASSSRGLNNSSPIICSIGDVLVNQFSGCSADRMKKVYGKFCSRQSEAVNLYKDLHAKDKRFQAYIKRIMSSSIVRRLSIPECILLVTQRITKYPVLIQRILQHTKDSDEDHSCVCEALRCVKELIAAVDSKVNEQEKKQRLKEVYSRTDSKSIMRMKSGQMFAKEDLIRGRKLLHDGALQLKNSAGRLKDVHAILLSDVLVFLQEKDQKYVFASLDQRSTVISLQNLIVREVANEERGLFLITAGIEKPEMVEVLASSKDERNTWRAIVQDAMHCMEKDEDEGVPSETEEDRRQQESRAKEIRELLRRKDEQIISLLEEKVHIFRDLGECNPTPDDTNPPFRERMLFRATSDDVTKGEPVIKDALREVETLHALLSSGVGGAGCSVPGGLTGGSVGPVCLPRRAETFGGFDSHQMNSSKNGEKEEGDETPDLRRTESDSVLKKGVTASLQMLLKRNNEVQHSVTHLHELLMSLQAVVVQQDSFIEDQRITGNSSRHSSSSSLSSSSSSRPSSLIEQEKHRSLERQRQEAASLQKQQAAHQEEKRRREKVWEVKEKGLAEREEMLRVEEEETRRRRQELMEERESLLKKKEEYQRELERLREAQRRLERDQEALRRDAERLEAMKRDESEQVQRYQRTPSTTSEDSVRFHSSGSLDLDSKEAAEQPKEGELSSSAPTKEPFLRIGSKRMGKNFNPFSSSSSSKPQGAEKESQLPTRLLQLAKPKEKTDKKKKKKAKGGEQTQSESKVTSDPQNDGDIFFC